MYIHVQCPHSPVVCCCFEASFTGLQVGVASPAPLTSVPVERGGQREEKKRRGRDRHKHVHTL